MKHKNLFKILISNKSDDLTLFINDDEKVIKINYNPRGNDFNFLCEDLNYEKTIYNFSIRDWNEAKVNHSEILIREDIHREEHKLTIHNFNKIPLSKLKYFKYKKEINND